MQLHNRTRYALTLLVAAAALAGATTAEAVQVEVQQIVIPSEGSVEIDDATWAKAKENRGVQRWLAEKYLIEGNAPTTAELGANPAQPGDVRSMSEPDAIRYVKACESADELRQLGGIEARPKVKAAIRKRVHELGE